MHVYVLLPAFCSLYCCAAKSIVNDTLDFSGEYGLDQISAACAVRATHGVRFRPHGVMFFLFTFFLLFLQV